ncbi:hypothetical protein Tco_0896237 [Tanacetum coccineum]
MIMGRISIATKLSSYISETVAVVIHSKTFEVQVKEVGTWSTSIVNDSDDSDSEDKFGDEESLTTNGDVKSNEDIDDFIEKIVEEKANSNSTKEPPQEVKEDAD